MVHRLAAVSGCLMKVLVNLYFSQSGEETWSTADSELLGHYLSCCSSWSESNERAMGLKSEEISFVLICSLTVVVFCGAGKRHDSAVSL